MSISITDIFLKLPNILGPITPAAWARIVRILDFHEKTSNICVSTMRISNLIS